MSLRIVIVGPGRVGSAMARRLAAAGASVLGFVGRDPTKTAAAIAFAGVGRQLRRDEIASAHVVLFAVGDPDLQAAIDACALASGPRACSLWVHTSGRAGLEVFAAVGPGIRRGALHPVAPIPSATAGLTALAGAPALVEAGPRSERLLRRLCALAGLLPVPCTSTDRLLYHAACALAANGLTALRALVDRTFAAAGGVDAGAQRVLADALMNAALRACSEAGTAAALSGPVRRGDAATVLAHLRSLAARVPDAEPAYRALMAEALRLAGDLSPAQRQAMHAALEPERKGTT